MSRGRSPNARPKPQSLEHWTAAQVERWFKTYKDGKYAAEYPGFAGLDGAGLSKLTQAEFLLRSSKGDLLYRVVVKATAGEAEQGRSPSASRGIVVAPHSNRSKSPAQRTGTLHLNKEQEEAVKASARGPAKDRLDKSKMPEPKGDARSDTDRSSVESIDKPSESPDAKPKITVEAPEEGSKPPADRQSSGQNAAEIVKQKCEAEGCDAIAVQGIWCAHHRLKRPDEDGNATFSGSFVLGENAAESDKKLHDKLEAIFARFAAQTNTMDKGRWIAACEQLNLVDSKTVRRLDVELVFNVIKPVKGKPVLQFEHFCRGLSQIALKKYPDKGGRSLRYMVRTDLARA